MNLTWSKAFLIIIATVGAVFSYQAFTGGFSIEAITYEWEDAEQWQLPQPSSKEVEDAKSILAQKFRYLSRGNQTYVFVSDDGQYVLKFFRFAHLKPSPWLEILPNIEPIHRYRTHKRKSQEKRLQRIFQSHYLADTKDRDNCGLLYVHLHNTKFFNSNVTVIDRVGLIREIDLDNHIFVIQKMARVARDEFKELLRNNHIDAVKVRIDQIIALYRSEHLRGVHDTDHNVIDNVAFSVDKAIRIDVGKLFYDEAYTNNELSTQDIDDKVGKRLRRWTKKYFPAHYDAVDAYLNAVLETSYTRLHTEGQ